MPALLSFLFLSILLFGSVVSAQKVDLETKPRILANDNYKIGPGDVIDVVVSKNDTLTRTGLRVSNLGTVQLAMLDADVPAACLTERQLADSVKEKYRKYLNDPFVSVSVREFNSSPVAVIGAVNSAGRFQLQRQIRLVELLTMVNGPSAKAGDTVDIIRPVNRPYCDGADLVTPAPGSEEFLSVNLSDAFKGREQANPVIFAGDIIRVADADQTNAYIQGNVKSGMTIDLKEPVTLVQAVAMAGGTTAGADLTKVRIRRQIPGSLNRDEIIVNLKEINQRKRDDILLQANDIVEIPGPSGVRKVFQDLYKTVVPSITQLPMRVVY